jgi:hypothetical protein
MVINAIGAVASGAVLVTAAVTKFLGGAWVVLVLVPLLATLLLRIRVHYTAVGEKTTISNARTAMTSEDSRGIGVIGRATPRPALRAALHHLFVVPLAHLDLPSLRALAYAVSLGQPTLVLHVSPEKAEAEQFQAAWDHFGAHVPLEVVISPYRAVVGPIVNYLEALHTQSPELTLTVVVPQLKVMHLWQRLLHDRLGERLRRGLERQHGIAVIEVPFHLTR